MRRPLALALSLVAVAPAWVHAQGPASPAKGKTPTASAPKKAEPPSKQAPPAKGAPSPSRPADPVRELVERMQKFYESTRDLHARFDQTLETGAGRKRNASGELWLKKPGRMRWEYQKPEKKLMVADGQTLWVYEPEDQQAFRQDLKSSSLPSSVTFLLGEGRLGDEFEITRDDAPPAGLGGPGLVVLKLVPKKATTQYRYLQFAVDEKTAMVQASVIYDQQGGQNRMTFRDVELNKGVGDERFKFTPPAGTRILRP